MLGTQQEPGMMFLTMVDLFRLVAKRSDEYSFEVGLCPRFYPALGPNLAALGDHAICRALQREPL